MTNPARPERHHKDRLRFVRLLSRWLPILIMLYPFLIAVCALLILEIVLGVVKLLTFFGLSGWLAPAWGVGLVVACSLGLLLAARIGTLLHKQKN